MRPGSWGMHDPACAAPGEKTLVRSRMRLYHMRRESYVIVQSCYGTVQPPSLFISTKSV